MKITFFEVPKTAQDIFLQAFPGAEVSFFEEKLTESTVEKAKDAEAVSVFINSTLNKSVIEKLPNLKFIATRSTGYDHIDFEFALARGIKISNVPAYGSHTVAEFAFGLLLNLSRKISRANSYIRESPDYNFFSMMEGFDLMDKTIGVIGTGKIGKNVIKIAKGFGMKVIAYDLHPDMPFAQANNFVYKTFAEVVAESDVLTLHAPYNKENHHLINRENIAQMKKGVCLINTARGELVDTDALLWGLKEGIIGGAGLDVLEGERELKEEIEILASPERAGRVQDYKTLLMDRVLIEMPNVIITPHIAFYSVEAEGEIAKTTIDNLQGFVAGNAQNLISA